jgi:hypothetical protein
MCAESAETLAEWSFDSSGVASKVLLIESLAFHSVRVC